MFALWLTTMPVAMSARVGSFLYKVNVIVNEPLLTWVRVTGKGRAESVSLQLQKHYEEVEDALISKDDKQISWAKSAEADTAGRAQVELNRLVFDQNFTVAHTLASQMYAVVLAHQKVLYALASNPTLGIHKTDVEFTEERVIMVKQNLDSVNLAFAAKYARVDFLKGIDAKLSELKQGIAVVNLEMGDAADNLTTEERWSYTAALDRARMLQIMANTYLGQDRYVESYKSANEALGLVLEMRIMLQSSQKFHVEILNHISI